jgi:hypothetical protein
VTGTGPQSSPVATLAVVALVVLAGCGSFAGGGGGGDGESGADGNSAPGNADGTVTAAPVPEVTPTPDPWPVAPGLSAQGVVNVDALVAAHLRAVRGQSYVWREWRGRSPNETVPLELRQRARVESENTYGHWSVRTVGSRVPMEANYSQYVVDGAGYAEVPSYGLDRTVRRPVEATGATERIGTEAAVAIGLYLNRSPARTTVSETTVDGRRYYRVVSEGGPIVAVANPSNVTVTALVSAEGFVRSLSVRYRRDEFDGTGWVRYEFAYENVGETTVDPPDWVTEWNGSAPAA